MKNILNQEVDNRIETLKINFPECFDRDGNLNIQKFQEIVEPSNKVFKDSYGLNWLGKTYARKLAQLPISTVLSEDKEHNEKEENKNSENIYIKGDNLEVLRHLISAYSEKVKMIYIDPPYNTGNGDFVYNDDRSFTEKELEKLIEINAIEENEKDRILSWIDSKSSSHSAWLTFMFPRLYLARKLLREDGVIFISIDDNEASQLKLLCDEIFGEENFEGNINWRRRSNQPNDKTKLIGLVAEHIIVYAKSSKKLKLSGVGKLELTGKFSNPDNDPRGEWASKPWKVGSDQNGSNYSIKTPTGHIYIEEWMGDENTFQTLLNDGRIIFTNNGKGAPRKKYYKLEREKEGQCATNWWPHELFGNNQEGNDEMTKLFENKKNIFSNPKNLKLLKAIIQLGNIKEKEIILDFFSGSATTAHAVMQLNAEDSGNRKYIMIQLEEEIKEKITKEGSIIKSEASNFCEKEKLSPNITSIGIERIKRAAKKIKEETNAEIDYGFKIYSVKDVPNTIIESMEKFDPSTLKLFESKLLTEEEKLAILTTYKVFDGNMLNENIERVNLGDSSGYKIGSILYLIDEIKSSSVIKTIIEKLDSDKNFTINKIVIYGYTQLSGKYRTELKENIKTYANKKSATIDVEVRY